MTEHDIAEILQKNLKKYILAALKSLYRYDNELFCNPENIHVHEAALTTRFAMHLRDQLRHNLTGIDFERFELAGYRVDCEYNRHGSDPKTDSSNSERRPDILIHKRAIAFLHGNYNDSSDQNILFCEAKWGKLDNTDKDKLEMTAKEYQYYCSLGIDNITGEGIKLVFRFANNDYQEQTEKYKWDAKNQKLVKE